MSEALKERGRWATALAWIAGGSFGLIVNFVIVSIFGDEHVYVTTFVTFALGATLGTLVSDKLGPKYFRAMGMAAGVLVAIAATLLAAGWMHKPESIDVRNEDAPTLRAPAKN